VELNPQMIALVRDTFADYAGGLYDQPGVALHVAEARGFVAGSDGRYDLVQVALLDSFAASGSGTQALNENYLYTAEAIGRYIARLKPGGYLAITRWLKVPPRDSLKLAATAAEALRQAGVQDPGRRLAAIRSWSTVTLLLKNGDLTERDIEAVRRFSASRSFDAVWYPSMAASEANRFNRLERPWFHEGFRALLGPGADEFVARYKFNIEAASDERPYFFNSFRWRALPEVLALRERGGAALVEWGYLVPAATLVQAALAGLLLILLPLAGSAREWPAGLGRKAGAYFFTLGLAFLFVEMAFIQKLILFLSHPLYSIAVVLAGFLVFAGIGSGLSEAIGRRFGNAAAIRLAVVGIVLLSAAYLLALPPLFEAWIAFADPVRIALSLGLIAPLAVCMGMPFPLGLRQLADGAPGFVPWAWGLNGFASVVSTALATLLAIELGFSAVLTLALLLYLGAAIMARLA
jgi:hypothetical protein